MKTILTLITILFLKGNIQSQITKKNWLVGGDLKYISSKITFNNLGEGRLNYLSISPNVGFFIKNNFAIGIKVNAEKNKYTLNSTIQKQQFYSIGPFFRYYFLKNGRIYNIFSETSYQYSISKPSNQSNNILIFSTGAVLFLNTSVGLEFNLGYSLNNSVNSKNNSIKFGIGFQIHLEKDKP